VTSYELVFPDYLDGYEHETEAKCYLPGVRIVVDDGRTFEFTAYDPTRLAQEVADEVASDGFFCEARLVVVPRVTREDVAEAVRRMSEGGFAALL
jgi:hypothetical protein